MMTHKFIPFVLSMLLSCVAVAAPPLVVMEMDNGAIEKPCSIAYVNGQFETMTSEGVRMVLVPQRVKTIRVNPCYIEMPQKLDQYQKEGSRLAILVSDLQTSISVLKTRLSEREHERALKEREIQEKTDLIKKQEALIASREARIRETEERAEKAEKLASENEKQLARLSTPTFEEIEFGQSEPSRIQVGNPNAPPPARVKSH
jgi:hypothetical protein